jgi:isopenicillin N synthase-like dioxygenase
MANAGSAWRGWFPLGGELTSGRPDGKEGLYFGSDDAADDPRPLHGANQWPAVPPELRDLVQRWMRSMTELGQLVLDAIAVGIGLDREYFRRELTADPIRLFRIFRYPPLVADADADASGSAGGFAWSVAEHTDYGLLTLLATDGRGGLEVRRGGEWIEVPPARELIVCNLGDMLDRMTGGRYRSTPHRVRWSGPGDRLSFPFFLDPGWSAVVEPLPLSDAAPPDDAITRWDGTSLQTLAGTYGEYLAGKVAKVFPALPREAH